MPSRARQAVGKRQNNSLGAAFRCSGRSSMASNRSATKSGRTLSARGRPVARFSTCSNCSATPEPSMTPVQKEIASSESADVKTGTGRPGLTRS